MEEKVGKLLLYTFVCASVGILIYMLDGKQSLHTCKGLKIELNRVILNVIFFPLDWEGFIFIGL